MTARLSQQILRATIRAPVAPRASVVRGYSVLARSRGVAPCAPPVKVNYNRVFVWGEQHELKYTLCVSSFCSKDLVSRCQNIGLRWSEGNRLRAFGLAFA